MKIDKCCRTCLLWQPDKKVVDDEYPAGEDNVVDDPEANFGECLATRSNRSRSERPRLDAPAIATDGSGYLAVLATRADFCCNQWEQRDVTQTAQPD